MFDMTPFRRNRDLSKEDYFDQLFNFFNDDFFSPMNFSDNSFRADIKETENEYVIEADLPGIKKEDIDIDYMNNYLTISAKRNESVEEKHDNYVRRERRSGDFKRSFYVDNVNDDNIEASFNNGVLQLVLPKKNKGNENKRKINIK